MKDLVRIAPSLSLVLSTWILLSLQTLHANAEGAIHSKTIAGRPMLITSSEKPVLTRATLQDRVKRRAFRVKEEQYLVRLKTNDRTRALEKFCEICSFSQYTPHDTALIVTTPDKIQTIQEMDGVVEILFMPTTLKLSREIQRNIRSQPAFLGSYKRQMQPRHGFRVDANKAVLNILLGKDVLYADIVTLCDIIVQARKSCDLTKISGKKWTVELDKDSRLEFILHAMHHPLVVWIEDKPFAEIRNRFAAGLVQGSDWQTGNSRIIWDQGLRGEGEIIGISDTGVDYHSCYFRDDNVPVPTCKGDGFVNVSGCINHSHRKIVTYRFFEGTNVGDDYGGHGTHVCGSALGNLSGLYTDGSGFSSCGMAPSAKLAFDDLSSESERLVIPADLNTILFPHAYNVGARIHTLSWGSPFPGYDTQAMEVDQFTYDNPDFLVLVAAGNEGPYIFSVGSPATAKNALTVGASRHSFAALSAYGKFISVAIKVLDGPGNSRGTFYRAQPASFGPSTTSSRVWNGSLTEAHPRDACSFVQPLKGKIALIQRGNCSFITKLYFAQVAGAVAAIVSNNVAAQDMVQMSAGNSEITIEIPSVMISLEDGDALRALMMSGPVFVQLPSYESLIDQNSSNELSHFSSQGPVLDMRIKPDILCPGEYIHSALSHGNSTVNQSQCGDVIEMSGTSMASPICAGSAALVRQYFRNGFYPSGKRNLEDALEPNASLVKAMMIHSAQRVEVYSAIQGWVTPKSLPDPSQGYGRVDLTQILRFADKSFFNLSIWTHSLSSGEHIDYCVKIESPLQALKVTLVWTDPPAFPGSGRNLVNDLDLVLIDCSNSFYYGNERTDSDYPNSPHPAVDTINNCEQVSIPSPRFGCSYVMRVQAPDVPLSPQAFALVSTGLFTVVPCEEKRPLCPSNCSGHGTCNAGRCECCIAYSGTNCSLPNRILACNSSHQIAVSEFGWTYSVLGIPDLAWQWRLDIYWPNTMYPGFFLAKDRFPSQGDCDICLNSVAAAIFINASYYADSHYDNLDSATISCEDFCIAHSADIATQHSGSWVFGTTAYTSSGIVSLVKFTCYPPSSLQESHIIVSDSGTEEENRGFPENLPAVWIQIQTVYTTAEFTLAVQRSLRQALATCAQVQESQVCIGAITSFNSSKQSILPNRVQQDDAALASSQNTRPVSLNVIFGNLDENATGEAVIGRLSISAINAHMNALQLPGVQLLQAPEIVYASKLQQINEAAGPFFLDCQSKAATPDTASTVIDSSRTQALNSGARTNFGLAGIVIYTMVSCFAFFLLCFQTA